MLKTPKFALILLKGAFLASADNISKPPSSDSIPTRVPPSDSVPDGDRKIQGGPDTIA